MACVRISACPMFKSFSMRSALRVWQLAYCEGNFERCQRWVLSKTGQPVPQSLLPNGRMMPGSLEALEEQGLQHA